LFCGDTNQGGGRFFLRQNDKKLRMTSLDVAFVVLRIGLWGFDCFVGTQTKAGERLFLRQNDKKLRMTVLMWLLWY